MIGILITIWFVLTGIYYLLVAGMRIAVTLPAAVLFVVCLPAMPFIVAYRNRREHPTLAKAIYWIYGILYALIALILIIDGHL